MNKNLILTMAIFPSVVFGIIPFGGEESGRLDIAVATVQGPSSISVNPAGLAKIERNSISASANSYNYSYTSNDDIKTSLTSSANNTALIRSTSNYNLGFAILNPVKQSGQKSSTKTYKNGDGIPAFERNQSDFNMELNYYILSFAPKKSHWGLGLSLAQIKMQSQAVNHEYSFLTSQLDNTKHKFSSFNSDINYLSASLLFGIQKNITSNFRFGIVYKSPEYLIQNNSEVIYSSENIYYTDANTPVITSIFGEDKPNLPSKLSENIVNLGFAYTKNQSVYEFNLRLKEGYKTTVIQSTLDTTTLFYQSNTGSVTSLESDSSNDESNSTNHLGYTIAMSLKKQLTDYTLNSGFSLTPTNQRSRKGTDDMAISFGITKPHKNFLGIYSFVYGKSFDTGNNTDSFNKKVNLDQEYITLLFGGNYSF